jgi:energy-coupling factor transporter ATP-binding protein EcfA2
MKQKLGFAQVLIGDPKLIVVDEPTVGLDPEQRNMIRELFPIISRGRIVMATTHIVEDIEYYCNYLLVMKEGQLIPFNEIFLYSVTTNIFIIALALFILFLTRDIPVSLVLLLSFYLIEEHLWRAKITRQFGILGHIYTYIDATRIGFIKIKAVYLICSLILAILALKMAGSERRYFILRK